MNIEKVQEEYNLKLGIRDNLTIIKSEMVKLEEDEKVREYKSLKTYYDLNKSLDNLEDDDILFSIIDNATLEFPLPECYFCLGEKFKAGIRKNGEYYLLPEDGVFGKLKPPIIVGVYKNLENPSLIKIIPEKNIREFEEKYPILRAGDQDADEEYKNIRRMVVKDELSRLGTKVYEKNNKENTRKN